ncbi:MAG TPA: alpha-ribazole phosphatase, partial [Clostridiales bacterium UBA8960]|nr:alpha-ribazole phosphatase [Clostridiales bacterium UBA8960]
IFLIRHGETTANVAKRFAGVWDVELTEKGVGQAILTGEKLKDIAFDAIYCSDLKRAHDTAVLVSKHQSVKPEKVSAFREMNFGIWEGKMFSEIKESDGALLNQWFSDFEHFKVPEGESVKEMFERVTNAYKNIIAPYSLDSDTKIAIIAHGGVIQTLLSYLCYGDNSGYWRFRIDNCGINKIQYSMGYPVVQGINQ